MDKIYDCIVIGGGQAGLSAAYFLRRAKLDFLILDKQEQPGGAWIHTWDSLKLFSTAQFSSLSGWAMPKTEEEYPSKKQLLDYLTEYEQRYKFPIQRSTVVEDIIRKEDYFEIQTATETFHTKTVISATGTWGNPFIPDYPNRLIFQGLQIHSSQYKNSDSLYNKKTLIIGAGNSAAQILAEVSKVSDCTWVTLQEPVFLPDHIDGHYLFNQANARYLAIKKGLPLPKPHSLANIVMTESVKEARDRKALSKSVRPFKAFYERGVLWEDGTQEQFDAVIWCTGFKAHLPHLINLNIIDAKNRILTQGTKSKQVPGLWLVGYGNWTGFASATLYGVGKTARDTVKEIVTYLK